MTDIQYWLAGWHRPHHQQVQLFPHFFHLCPRPHHYHYELSIVIIIIHGDTPIPNPALCSTAVILAMVSQVGILVRYPFDHRILSAVSS